MTIPVAGNQLGTSGQAGGKPLITIVTAGSAVQGVFYK